MQEAWPFADKGLGFCLGRNHAADELVSKRIYDYT